AGGVGHDRRGRRIDSTGSGGTSTTEAGLRADARCAAGARTLSAPGDVLYPEVGNGGYTSVHTATHTVYDAATNRFLPGNHVELTDRATQCLSSLSLDFERFEPGHPKGSPEMQVQSVSIDDAPASFRFAQPTYPGDPQRPHVAVLYHENFHQLWGDNVSEGNFDMAFYKEGMATLSVQLYSSTTARPARRACRSSSSGGLTPPTTAPSRRSPDRGCTATRSTPMAARRPAVA
ncbi:MAG TPA: hypothetical protein VIK30_15850, partial [Polyangia bacterium]